MQDTRKYFLNAVNVFYFNTYKIFTVLGFGLIAVCIINLTSCIGNRHQGQVFQSIKPKSDVEFFLSPNREILIRFPQNKNYQRVVSDLGDVIVATGKTGKFLEYHIQKDPGVPFHILVQENSSKSKQENEIIAEFEGLFPQYRIL